MADIKEKTPNLPEDHSLALEYNIEFDDDRKNYQIALLIAIVVHVFIIWARIPEGSGPVIDDGQKEKKVIRRVILTPPPEQKLEDIKMKQQVKKVPIPDPTPDEPEPIVEIDDVQEENLDLNDMDDYIVGMPSAPPAPTGPVRSGIAGLTDPKYSREQLMQNVVYPELGKKARMQGFVILEVVLRKDGTVGDIKVIGGNLKALGFPEAAIRGARKLSFEPGTLRGVPVDVIMTLTVNFQLKN